MIFLLTYRGKKRWNYHSGLVVRAPSEEAALHEAVPSEERGDWEIEAIDPDGDTETILHAWVGDPG